MAAVTNLLEEAARRFHVFYGGYLSNHVVHGLIALGGMDASEERMTAFFSSYEKHDTNGHMLEPRHKPEFTVTKETWTEFEGIQANFPAFYEYFLQRILSKELESCLEELAPLIADRMPAYALHCFIHLGFGLRMHEIKDADATIALAEALALIAISGDKLGSISESEGSVGAKIETVVDALAHLRGQEVLERIYRDPEFRDNDFDFNGGLRYLQRTMGGTVLATVEAWIAAVKAKGFDEGELEQKLVSQLCRAVLVCHWGMACKDFFLLHGVTSLYALTVILRHTRGHDQHCRLIKNFAVSFLLTYLRVGAPTPRDIQKPPELPSWGVIWSRILAAGSDKNDEVPP